MVKRLRVLWNRFEDFLVPLLRLAPVLLENPHLPQTLHRWDQLSIPFQGPLKRILGLPKLFLHNQCMAFIYQPHGLRVSRLVGRCRAGRQD